WHAVNAFASKGIAQKELPEPFWNRLLNLSMNPHAVAAAKSRPDLSVVLTDAKRRTLSSTSSGNYGWVENALRCARRRGAGCAWNGDFCQERLLAGIPASGSDGAMTGHHRVFHSATDIGRRGFLTARAPVG